MIEAIFSQCGQICHVQNKFCIQMNHLLTNTFILSPFVSRWRGSIYKLVWLDLVCFLFLYYTLNIIYRTVLDEDKKK